MSRFLSTGLSALSNIRSQVTEFTNEVLTESTQEVDDPVSELSVAKKRVSELEQLLATRNSEVDKLRTSNTELEERVHVFEFQLRQVTQRHKEAIEEKEAEIQRLQSISTGLDVPASSSSSQHQRQQQQGRRGEGIRDSLDEISIDGGHGLGGATFSPPSSPTGNEFETRKLREELKQMKAECQHWKQLVNQRDVEQGQSETGANDGDSNRLRTEIMDLHKKLNELVESHQHELADLQEVHRSQMASLARSYDGKNKQQQGGDDGWGAGGEDWETDDWNASSTTTKATESKPREDQEAQFDPAEKQELENRLATLQLENKRLHKLVDDLRKDEETVELNRLQDENAELQRSVEALDAEHAQAIEKLLDDRRRAEQALNETKSELALVREEFEKKTNVRVEEDQQQKDEDAEEKLRMELQTANASIDQWQARMAELSSTFEQDHRRHMDELRDEYESQLQQSQREKSALLARVDQLTTQCRELNVAYEDLNGQYESQKNESGSIVDSNRELHRKLESLKADLIEYEEKYERCKRDNAANLTHLETLTNELSRLKSEFTTAAGSSSAIGGSKKWQSEVLRLTKELEESLRKREELVKSVQDFRVVVDRFDHQIQKFRSENEQLKRENEELRVASGCSSPQDFRRVFEDTDQELQILRRSLSEYQDTFVQKEKVWRDQMEALKEENETLKTRTPSTPGSARGSDNGESSGSSGASYVHIEMTHHHGVEGQQPGHDEHQQPSPQDSNESSSGGVGLLSSGGAEDRRESQELIVVDEESLKSLVDQQRLVIDQLQESNRRFKAQIVQLTTDGNRGAQFEDDHHHPEEEEKWDAEEEDNGDGGWNDWGESSSVIEKKKRPADDDVEPKQPIVVEDSSSNDQQRQQLKESLDALNEKTDECEKLNQELEQKRRDVKEREELVQQVFTELKGLELQMAENRQREQELKDQVAGLNLELHREKESNGEARRRSETADSDRSRELDDLRRELATERSTVENLRTELNASRTLETNARGELSRMQSSLMENADEIGREYERLRAEYEQLKTNFDVLMQEAEQSRASLDKSRMDVEKIKKESDEHKERAETERNEKEKLNSELERIRGESLQLREEIDRQSAGVQNVEVLNNEKQQLIVLLNGKHEENIRFHQECQRLASALAQEQARAQMLTRKAEAASQRPPTTEMQAQTEPFVDEERTRALEHCQRLESELATIRTELDEKSRSLVHVENHLKNESIERDSTARRELQQAIQAKDRAVGEMVASRQHAEALQTQLRTSEEMCSRQTKEIERLRAHLLQIEEAYTHEAVKSEERETELRRRLREAEEQLGSDLENVKDGNRKMADQLSDLRVQLESMAEQRDNALLQYADGQIELEKQQKSLVNLQSVLQHLQKERDSIISNEVKRFKHETDLVKEQKRQLEQQLRDLQKQLLECQQNMNASSAFVEQANIKEKVIAELKSQINAKDDQCAMLQSKLQELQRVRDSKIDKDVLKNIFLGYFCAPANKKPEVAHLLGAILGFTNDEFKKIEYGAGAGGWLQFLRGGTGTSAGTNEQSIAEQFVKFLETESKPAPPTVPLGGEHSSASSSSRAPSLGPLASAGGYHPQASSMMMPGGQQVPPRQSSRSSTPGLNLELPTFGSSGMMGATSSGFGSEAGSSGAAGSDFLRDLLSKSNEPDVI